MGVKYTCPGCRPCSTAYRAAIAVPILLEKKTFVEYLTAVRIEAAKQLLTCGNSRMSDIAFDVGYQDSHYFSYLFKKHVGVSPREYRSRSEEG